MQHVRLTDTWHTLGGVFDATLLLEQVNNRGFMRLPLIQSVFCK